MDHGCSEAVRPITSGVSDDNQFGNSAAHPLFWPSVGEYPVYDGLLYRILSGDQVRNSLYHEAIEALAPGRTVVDIGTGASLIWARCAADSGATHVYAIESQKDSYERAAQRIAELGLGDRVTLIHGLSSEIELPTRVDLCVSEIIGSIGSSEGSIAVLNDARERFLVPGGAMIPAACSTLIAMAQLPIRTHEKPQFRRVAKRYVERIFAHNGQGFDVRVMLDRIGPEITFSSPARVEHLEFEAPLPERASNSFVLVAQRAARLDGLIAWIRLRCTSGGRELDSLHDTTNWLPVFFPIFYPGVTLESGDRVEGAMEIAPSRDGVHPDYRLEGRLITRGAQKRFEFDSPYLGSSFQGHPFYRALFGG